MAGRQRGLQVPGDSASRALLRWYDREARILPWRVRGGRQDPYLVWLSEIMLQQTTVKAVIPYFLKFVRTWPTVTALAAAPLDEILAAWAGLGYYSRARNLHRCAKAIVEQHAGGFPATESELRALPGVGPYTAAAIAAIAFDAPATPVDGNIERVVARLFAVEAPLPASKPELRRLAGTLTPSRRPGDHAQALMDLGATVCTPRLPSCTSCPLRSQCRAHALGIAPTLPRRSGKPARPVRHGIAFLLLREDGRILLRKRPESGLLGGMLEVPSSEWGEAQPAPDVALAAAPVPGNWRPVPGVVVHTFTHFRLEMMVYRLRVDAGVAAPAGPSGQWVARQDLGRAALPSVMRKLIAHGLGARA